MNFKARRSCVKIFLLLLSLLFCMCKRETIEPENPKIPSFSEVFDSLKTGLPIVFIYTENAKPIVAKNVYLWSDIYIVDSENPSNNLAAKGAVRGRGNDTWGLPKKPYRIKFEKKESLFGLTAARDWILLANYRDYTLMLNSIAFELGQRFKLPFTHHTIPVEVVLNGTHIGSYVLTEHKEVGEGRVVVDRETGWLVEADAYWNEEPKFKSKILQLPFMICFPENLSESRYDFIKSDINQLEAKLFEVNYPNNDFMDYLDVNSFVDFIMINEIVQNYEIRHPKSMYWYKEESGAKISLGPLWDYDWAFGFSPETGHYFMDYGGLIFKNTSQTSSSSPGAKLLGKLFESSQFRMHYKQKWNENYSSILSMTEFIDSYAQKLEKSQKLNEEIWGWKGNGDYMQEIARMKQWWINRINFLNSKIQNY